VIAALGIASTVLERMATVQAAVVQAPRFEVDPMLPKPLPNHWIMGNVIGVSVDSQDRVWIIHRGGITGGEGGLRHNESSRLRMLRSGPRHPCLRPGGNLAEHWGGKDGDGYV
jgi:hypothetical protein